MYFILCVFLCALLGLCGCIWISGQDRPSGGFGEDGERGAGFGFVLEALEDDTAEEPPSIVVLEHRGQDIGSFGADGGHRELEAIGTAGAIPMLLLLLQGEERPDPRIDDAFAARIGIALAVAEQLEHHTAGGLGGVVELILKFDFGLDTVGMPAVGPVFDLGEDGVEAHAGGAEHRDFGVVALDGFGGATGEEKEEQAGGKPAHAGEGKGVGEGCQIKRMNRLAAGLRVWDTLRECLKQLS